MREEPGLFRRPLEGRASFAQLSWTDAEIFHFVFKPRITRQRATPEVLEQARVGRNGQERVSTRRRLLLLVRKPTPNLSERNEAARDLDGTKGPRSGGIGRRARSGSGWPWTLVGWPCEFESRPRYSEKLSAPSGR
jgi:hypothetical protein